jgi:trans-aconitate 2-methyltransferase
MLDEAIGVDSSTAMLEQAEAHASTRLSFEVGDIGVWTDDGEFDLVFSNAALHWVPDHASVLARWRDALRPGGQLAVQVPANADHPAPQAAARVARREPYFTALDENPPPDAVTANVASPERYAQALHELGFVEQSVRLQVYGHVLPSHDAVIEWIRGSTLTRFFARLPVEVHESFVDAVHAEYLSVVGPEEPVFYPFKRILMWGRLPQT